MATYMKVLIPVTGNEEDIKVTAVDLNVDPNKDKDKVTEDPAVDHLEEGDQVDLNKLHAGPTRRPIAVLFYSESSPGCVYYIGNKKYKVC